MKILVVGGGGREHAIIKKLKENPAVTEIFALPGNGGISADATCVPIGATDLDGIVQFVKEHPVDYAVVTPDDPLVLGCVDRLNEIGVPCFGPKQNAACIIWLTKPSFTGIWIPDIPVRCYAGRDCPASGWPGQRWWIICWQMGMSSTGTTPPPVKLPATPIQKAP